MKAEVDWHIAELLKKAIKQHQLGEALLDKAMAFETPIEESLLEKVIHQGATFLTNMFFNMRKMLVKH